MGLQFHTFIGVSMPAYLHQYDVLEGLKQGGIFLLNTTWTKEQLDRYLPNKIKKYLSQNNIRFYIINAYKIAQEVGLIGKFSISMQAAFFKLTKVLPFEIALEFMKDEIAKNFSKKSNLIVEQNLKAISLSIDALEEIEVPSEWANQGIIKLRPYSNKKYRNPSIA